MLLALERHITCPDTQQKELTVDGKHNAHPLAQGEQEQDTSLASLDSAVDEIETVWKH